MKVKIQFFGMIAEAVGTSSLDMQTDGIKTIGELEKMLIRKFPDIENFTYQIAMNQQIVSGTNALSSGSEVAILPPFAGG